MHRRRFSRIAASILTVLLLGAPLAQAHEVDHFSVPSGEQMMDMGPYFNRYFVLTVEEGVRKANAKIARELGERPPTSIIATGESTGRPQRLVSKYQTAPALAQCVRESFPNAVDLIEALERKLHSEELKTRLPGGMLAYKPNYGDSIYPGLHIPGDPRALFRIWRASVMEVYGSYVGTDKIGHFIDMGYHYYGKYRGGLDDGLDKFQAMQRAVDLGTEDVIFSESGVLGFWSAGAYSNADLVANYAGCLFYRNLTEPLDLEGTVCPPMVVREGAYWKISPHVKKPAFFARFISDHYDEVLNPSLYESGMRKSIREKVAERSTDLFQWYQVNKGYPADPAFYARRAQQLQTYYGENYGHQGEPEQLVHLGAMTSPTESQDTAQARR